MSSELVPPNTPQLVLVPENGPENFVEARTPKSVADLLCMSVGYSGIAFAVAIQLGQVSPLLESLGSDPVMTALIWCAGPIAGVVLLPLAGLLSDVCQSTLGRRRPFLLAGLLVMALCVTLMPYVPSLWMAALLLWGIEGGNNFAQGAYRPLIPDNVIPTQQASAFAMVSFAMGLGYVLGSLSGFFITDRETLFHLGAIVLLFCMSLTFWTTREVTPPKNEAPKRTLKSILNGYADVVKQLPTEGKNLCIANSFTWFAVAIMFVFFSVYVPHHVFNAHNSSELAYQKGVQWASLGYAVLNTSCFIFSLFIGRLCQRFSQKQIHIIGLLCFGTGFSLLPLVHNPNLMLCVTALMGIGWATTLSLPYAMFAKHLIPGKEGLMMGVFNMFISAPGMISGLIAGQLIMLMDNNVSVAMTLAGLSIFCAIFVLRRAERQQPELQVISSASSGKPPKSPSKRKRKKIA